MDNNIIESLINDQDGRVSSIDGFLVGAIDARRRNSFLDLPGQIITNANQFLIDLGLFHRSAVPLLGMTHTLFQVLDLDDLDVDTLSACL